MPAEVQVMCPKCGRPQRAGPPTCSNCGAALPDAPLPTVRADFGLRGGRQLRCVDGALVYLRREGAGPVFLPLTEVRRIAHAARPAFEALLLLVPAVVLLVLGHAAARTAGALLLLAALLGVGLLKVHAVLLAPRKGAGVTRWPLGWAWRGSSRDARFERAWAELGEALRVQGMDVERAEQGPRDEGARG